MNSNGEKNIVTEIFAVFFIFSSTKIIDFISLLMKANESKRCASQKSYHRKVALSKIFIQG